MRSNFQLILLLCSITVTIHAQSNQSPSLKLGDPAPPLRVRAWIKGEQVQQFEKGKVYVVEFWATWCKPCIAAMPRLSVLANKYKDTVTILSIDVFEKKTTSILKVKAFVDSMGDRMDYTVGVEDSNFMATSWLLASQEGGIPGSFIVNAEGNLAWIGHPMDLDEVLPKIVNNTWDIKEALANRNLEKYLKALDDSINYELMNYSGNFYKKDYIGKPDSALLLINEMVRKEPRLKYAPFITGNTFSALLKTNQQLAYEYGKEALATSFFNNSLWYFIINDIEWYSDKLNLKAEIYQLGAEAYQAKIDQIPYPEIADMFKFYDKMAAWYWRANNKSKAIEAQQKAIEILKSKKNFSKTDLAAFESRLQKYKK
jgi:thiol-disulfide isomerase/thioredoxin